MSHAEFDSVCSPYCLTGAAADWASLVRLSPVAARLALAGPSWAAPETVPCLTSPRPVVARAPLAGGLIREDVVGGSSPAVLCGVAVAGFGDPPDPDGFIHGAVTAADLGSLDLSICKLALIASPPARRDVRLLARDFAALSSALHAAGARAVALPAWSVSGTGVTSAVVSFKFGDGRDSPLAGLTQFQRARGGAPVREWGAWIVTGAP